MRLPSVACLLVVCGLGCRATRPTDNPTDKPTDNPAASSEDGARKAAASLARLGLPAGGDTSLDAQYDALFDTPVLSAAGERFFDRLAGAPKLAPEVEAFVAALLTDPRLMEATAQLVAQDPSDGMNAVVSRLGQGMDTPAVDAALDAALDAVFDAKAIDDAAGRLADSLLDHARLVPRMTELLIAWQPDLEAALGVPMHHTEFGARFEAHLGKEDRTARIERLVLEHLVADGAVPEAIAALVESQAFVDVAVARVSAMLRDPKLINAAAGVLSAMLSDAPPETLAAQLETLVLGPAIVDNVARWLDDVAALPETAAIGAAIGATLDDPELQAELHAIVVGVPKMRTARR